MTLADKRREVILKTLKGIHEEISNSTDAAKMTFCNTWIETYNEMLQRFKKIVAESGDCELNKILDYDFSYFDGVSCEVYLKASWQIVRKTSTNLKYKIVELMTYLEPSENKEPALQNNPSLCLAGLIENKGLLEASKANFNGGNYWSACSDAFRHLEVKIREKSKLSEHDIGKELVNKAFNLKTGKLRIPSCRTSSEEEGFLSINRGLVEYHRNAKVHREELISELNALKMIGYVDYMLNMLENAVSRTNPNQTC